MILETTLVGGRTVEFECMDTIISRWVCKSILKGDTYPYLPFVDDVRVVWDAGANCGATTVHFAHLYPEATIHSFEPGARQRAVLERNVASLPNVQVHPIGLSDVDRVAALYDGDEDSITSSLIRRGVNTDRSEEVDVRAAGSWAASHGITAIDILKLDVEGCETEVLTSLGPLVDGLKVLYVEYDSRQARRHIDKILEDTHQLYLGVFLALDEGECIYVSNELADHPQAKPYLLSMFKKLTG